MLCATVLLLSTTDQPKRRRGDIVALGAASYGFAARLHVRGKNGSVQAKRAEKSVVLAKLAQRMQTNPHSTVPTEAWALGRSAGVILLRRANRARSTYVARVRGDPIRQSPMPQCRYGFKVTTYQFARGTQVSGKLIA